MTGFYCAANWKMNKTPADASRYVTELKSIAAADELARLILLPPALIAYEVASTTQGSALSWGGQNAYFESKGAFTGENSPMVLKEMGAKHCLVGHSERRQIFGEPEDMIAAKVGAIQNAGLIPIVCVGETQDDRRWNRTQEVIARQTRQALSKADPSKPLMMAYEPVWAIGTGLVATPDQVEDAHLVLRRALKEWSTMTSDRVPILYGGSVKSENAGSLAALNNVNGFLIGGASLEAKELLQILRNSMSVRK